MFVRDHASLMGPAEEYEFDRSAWPAGPETPTLTASKETAIGGISTDHQEEGDHRESKIPSEDIVPVAPAPKHGNCNRARRVWSDSSPQSTS